MLPFKAGQDISKYTDAGQPLNPSASGLRLNAPSFTQEGPAIPSGTPSTPAGPSNSG